MNCAILGAITLCTWLKKQFMSLSKPAHGGNKIYNWDSTAQSIWSYITFELLLGASTILGRVIFTLQPGEWMELLYVLFICLLAWISHCVIFVFFYYVCFPCVQAARQWKTWSIWNGVMCMRNEEWLVVDSLLHLVTGDWCLDV